MSGRRQHRGWVVIPIAAALLVGADQAAYHAVTADGHGHGGLVDEAELRARPSMFPALRALLFQIWFIRIDADLKVGKLHKALRHAREALAFAPDLPEARVLLASVLGFDLAAREHDEVRRLSWIAEGLRVLEVGLERDPTDAVLHYARGRYLGNRARLPEFEQEFRRSRGVSVLDEACDALVQAAEYGRGTNAYLVPACWSLMERGDRELQAAMDGADLTVLRQAISSFERCAAYASELVSRTDPRREETLEEFQLDQAYAEVSAALCARYLSAASGEEVPAGDIADLIDRREVLFNQLHPKMDGEDSDS